MHGIQVHSEAVTFNSTGKGQLFVHAQSAARHCLKPVRGRLTQPVQRTTWAEVLKRNSLHQDGY